jgi:hypothetical protein
MARKAAASLIGFLIGVMFLTSASADAYLSANQFGPNSIDIDVSGEITQRDLAFFRLQSKEFESKQLGVWLNSRGGDVAAAMEIGRIIRSVDGWTHIPSGDRCYSSCALIFIAGVVRTNVGELGLHRPYFASAPLSRDQIEKQMPIMRAAVRKYVEEMGITESFLERMFNTDPSDINVLRGEESERIVPRTDPTYDEIITASAAQQFGLTTSEYRRRESLAQSCFTSQFKAKYPDCYDSTLWGLSPEVYRSRSAMVKTRCGISDSQMQVLHTTPRKDQRSLPLSFNTMPAN